MELVEITPPESVVPVYLEVLNEEEQAQRDAEQAQMQAEQEAREAERVAKEEAKASGVAKLLALGLTEEEAKAVVGI
jgi:regulator of protease activity HflC (stomatin/prohibitin superfamily)